MIVTYDTYEEWFEAFTAHCRYYKYNGIIDKDAFLDDYRDKKCAVKTAREFVDEMNS